MAKFISQDYDLIMGNDNTEGIYFRKTITFRPAFSENLLVAPQIAIENQASLASLPLGTIPDGEFGSWTSLYAKTMLSKVIVQYTPAQTMGVSNIVSDETGAATFGAADAIMYTVPFYDNVDKFITATNGVAITPDELGYSNVKVAPYARKHSIYKPWKRILKPTFFEQTTDFIGSNPLRNKKRMYIDMTGAESSECTGLCIMMPALRRGGEIDPFTTTPQYYPGFGRIFVLGKLTFTYVQYFKTRA